MEIVLDIDSRVEQNLELTVVLIFVHNLLLFLLKMSKGTICCCSSVHTPFISCPSVPDV